MPEIRAEITLTADGLSEALDGALRRLSDLSPALSEAGDAMMLSVRKNFASGGRPHKWPPLAKSTIRGKGHAAPLYRTGRMMGSVRYTAGPDTLNISLSVPYAGIQQKGGRTGRGGNAVIPPRPFLLFHPGDNLHYQQ